MWTKFFALFLLFVIVAGITRNVKVSSTERKCRDGQRYYDGCNTVFCEGGQALQTLMSCGQYDPVTDELIEDKPLPAPESFWES